MSGKTLENMIDDIAFECAEKASGGSDEYETLTLWIKKKSKQKYLNLQEKTDRKFGKDLRVIVEKAIDTVDQKVCDKASGF